MGGKQGGPVIAKVKFSTPTPEGVMRMRSARGWLRSNFAPTVYSELVEMANKWEQRAKEAAPVRTGALRDSICVAAQRDGLWLGAGVSYAGFVHFGTKKMKPRPFIEEGWRKLGGVVDKKLSAAAKYAMRKSDMPAEIRDTLL